MDYQNIRRGLSPFEAGILSDLVKEGKTIFSIGELSARVGSRIKARKMASRLAKKKWLERIGRGVYLVVELGAGSKPEWTADSYYIASKLVQPYYIGYYNLLNDYGWTEQVPLAITVATTKSMKNRVIHGVRYNFIRLPKRKFFGISEKSVFGHEIAVSDPEKTLVDALDHPEYSGGIMEVAKALYNASEEVDWNKLLMYAKKLGNGAVFKRLGYLAELMGLELPAGIKRKIRRGISAGYSPLSTEVKTKGRHNPRWNLIINVETTKESVLQ